MLHSSTITLDKAHFTPAKMDSASLYASSGVGSQESQRAGPTQSQSVPLQTSTQAGKTVGGASSQANAVTPATQKTLTFLLPTVFPTPTALAAASASQTPFTFLVSIPQIFFTSSMSQKYWDIDPFPESNTSRVRRHYLLSQHMDLLLTPRLSRHHPYHKRLVQALLLRRLPSFHHLDEPSCHSPD